MSDKKQVWIPPTTSKTIIFPLSEPSNAFETGSYDPCWNQVSLEEINQFISKMNAEYESYKKKWKDQNNKEGPFGFLVLLMFLVDIYLFFYSKTDPQSLISFGEAIILGSFLIFWISIMCGWGISSVDFLYQMKDKCHDLVDQQNEGLKDRGLKWHLPEQFPAWIELTKQMDKQNTILEIAAQEVAIPRTTDTTIILPRQRYKIEKNYSSEISRFTQDFYLPEMTNDRISSEEMQRFLSEINACLRISFEASYNISIALSFCLSLEFFALFYISNHFPNILTYSTKFWIAVLSTLICAAFSGIEIQEQAEKKNIQVKLACQKFLSRYNLTIQNRGLKWRLPDGFLNWIELCKDSQNENNNSQAINIPSENQALSTNPGNDLEANNLSAPLLKE